MKSREVCLSLQIHGNIPNLRIPSDSEIFITRRKYRLLMHEIWVHRILHMKVFLLTFDYNHLTWHTFCDHFRSQGIWNLDIHGSASPSNRMQNLFFSLDSRFRCKVWETTILVEIISLYCYDHRCHVCCACAALNLHPMAMRCACLLCTSQWVGGASIDTAQRVNTMQ